MKAHDWLAGGGEMGALIRSIDWSRTPLGPVDAWPQSLRTTVSLCLSSTFPILIAWGPERVQIYNDAYRPICGAKHPQSMGQRFNDCWTSALPVVGSIVDRAHAGEGSYLENLRMFLDRNGYLEEAWMTFSFSSIRDESGGVGGLFHPITEVTEKMLSARRTQALRELSARLSKAKSLVEIGAQLERAFPELELDVPFLLFYQFDEEHSEARLLARAGLSREGAAAPRSMGLRGPALWPVASALQNHACQEIENVRARLGPAPCGPYPELPSAALLIPVLVPGMAHPLGCLVAGVSARRALDESYRGFYEQLGSTLVTAASSVLAYEQEQRRAEALAEIDRAKTAFFSNVSHEFRTPLTLMLGPLEEALAESDELSDAHRQRLELINRNGLRLLKLVNTLLDFSRIEAGRLQAAYEPTDLAAFTRDLASAFRSAIERAGLRLSVTCDPLPAPAWVDRDMWEKIVLNLVSNAFKHTFEGGIDVHLVAAGSQIELVVRDTGTGIPRAELPRIFERFHRVQGARGRSFEGSGIGLALVQELVVLHGGSVQVESELGQGSTFRVTIPSGNAHLPRERLGALAGALSTGPSAIRAGDFVLEAAGWVDAPFVAAPGVEGRKSLPPSFSFNAPPAMAPPRVLLADDNADMRAYIKRLLAPRYEVEVVADGEAALQAALARPPDVILSDVMMPVRDGFGLLLALQADPRTAAVPVILISARAGEEATLQGLQAGAADYLVKPFSSRELVARVEGALRTADAQREVERERRRLSAVLTALHEGVILQDADGVVRYCNAAAERLLGLALAQLAGRPSTDPSWHFYHEDGRPAPGEERAPTLALQTGQAVVDQTLGLQRSGGDLIWLLVTAQPLREVDGSLAGAVSSFTDITIARHHAQEQKERAELEQQLLAIVSHDLRTPLNAVLFGTANLLARAGQDEREAKTVRLIHTSADRAVRLVHDLLDFTQARLGRGIPIARRPMQLAPSAQQTLEELRSLFPGRDVQLEVRGDTHGNWDEDRLLQVVHNLVSNALKYGRSAVNVTLEGDADELCIGVHNDGEPIPPALVPLLFQPYSKGVHDNARSGRSIGLGLFIVDRIVAAHGGVVRVRSNATDGTTFTVRVPRDPSAMHGQV